ncbi:Crp/Fnr family transcriptional regulator [Marinifilum caeruleilacunae]|jgi:CRP-like cAMP-binding protein|uniref:Crp/Fnr family transcriptional regulator n=1 Tax=Marinifilum caeruleilacunae TaxID=2499076 RepID=A0ABX1WRA1_9BACT|nr:Crp/Fnr family transcriptional regulator [Marinifilum caeruleilacunae]NOU58522.1 Crp/Fnr family transcriptional regulator [Marinifilum caeruleilacunae]
MNKLIEHIKQYAPLNDEAIELLCKSVSKRVFKRNDIIFSEGKISDEIYLLTKGCVRLFYNVDGTDKTAFFYTEGQFICAGESYTFNIPAIENYQAIEETELYVFTKAKIEELLGKMPEMEIIARIATENELITYQKLVASFVCKSAEERYVDLLNTQGDLFQRVPQQYIASFLGVSPETLSRIKNRVHKKLGS